MQVNNTVTVFEAADMNAPQPNAERGAYIHSLMSARTAKALKKMDEETKKRAHLATLQLIRCYANWGRTAEETAANAEFVAWCALGNLWHTPALDALIAETVAGAMRAYAMGE